MSRFSPFWNDSILKLNKILVTCEYDTLKESGLNRWWFSHTLFTPRQRCSSFFTDLVAIDPGIRHFITTFSSSGICHIFGRDLGAMQKAWKNRRVVKKLRDNMHSTIVDFLTRNYSVIMVPSKFNPKQQGCRVHSFVARSFSLFYRRLCRKAHARGCVVIPATEYYSTKTCSNCGVVNDVGAKAFFHCNACGFFAHRDINASKNIFLANFHKCKDATCTLTVELEACHCTQTQGDTASKLNSKM